jgi:hypothetical protein
LGLGQRPVRRLVFLQQRVPRGALAIAGAAVGGLAYYSEVALLHAMIWAAVLIWAERAVRNHLGDLIGDLFGWL